MSLEENKRLTRRMIDWWAEGDVTVIDETNTADFVAHQANGSVVSGRNS